MPFALEMYWSYFFEIEKARNDARRQAEQNARNQAKKEAAEGKI